MNTAVTTGQRPYFFWDYEITDDEVRAILRDGEPFDKAWVISRILEHATWDDIWRYLTVIDIRTNFESLHFRRSQDQELWAYALDRWTNHALSGSFLRARDQ
jgi:hypothetical protein